MTFKRQTGFVMHKVIQLSSGFSVNVSSEPNQPILVTLESESYEIGTSLTHDEALELANLLLAANADARSDG